jgi:hypothetical protein
MVIAEAAQTARIKASHTDWATDGSCARYHVTYSSSSSADVCDFTVNGTPQPATCDDRTKNSTIFQAANIPSACSVYAGASNITFTTDGVHVLPDYPDSYQNYTFVPTLGAYYWVASSGGTITPQFTIKFNGTTNTVKHQRTASVPCK